APRRARAGYPDAPRAVEQRRAVSAMTSKICVAADCALVLEGIARWHAPCRLVAVLRQPNESLVVNEHGKPSNSGLVFIGIRRRYERSEGSSPVALACRRGIAVDGL